MKRRSEVYRRRRLGALLVAAAIVYLLYVNAADAGTTAVSYTVTPGDTLWEIATEHYPRSEDPRAAIEAIRQENGLEGYRIRPGVRLELPRQSVKSGGRGLLEPTPPFEEALSAGR